MREVIDLLIVLWPLLLLNLAIIIWALVDLVRRKEVKGIPKLAWGAIILLVTFGAIVYLLVGRGEE